MGDLTEAETVLEIWPWAINYCSRNFSEPDKFVPERWLDEVDDRTRHFDRRRQNALQPFSVGPRNCIGKKYVCLVRFVVRPVADLGIPSHMSKCG